MLPYVIRYMIQFKISFKGLLCVIAPGFLYLTPNAKQRVTTMGFVAAAVLLQHLNDDFKHRVHDTVGVTLVVRVNMRENL